MFMLVYSSVNVFDLVWLHTGQRTDEIKVFAVKPVFGFLLVFGIQPCRPKKHATSIGKCLNKNSNPKFLFHNKIKKPSLKMATLIIAIIVIIYVYKELRLIC